MKKLAIFSLVLVLAMTLALTACNVTEPTQLGTSAFSIVLPEGYKLTEDDMSEDQVGYYFKDAQSIDFDVYQWEKNGEYTLEAEANYYAAEYDTVAVAISYNGINGWKYVSMEEYDGHTYSVINCMFEDDTYIVELCFWTIDSLDEYGAVNEILSTLKKN